MEEREGDLIAKKEEEKGRWVGTFIGEGETNDLTGIETGKQSGSETQRLN